MVRRCVLAHMPIHQCHELVQQGLPAGAVCVLRVVAPVPCCQDRGMFRCLNCWSCSWCQAKEHHAPAPDAAAEHRSDPSCRSGAQHTQAHAASCHVSWRLMFCTVSLSEPNCRICHMQTPPCRHFLWLRAARCSAISPQQPSLPTSPGAASMLAGSCRRPLPSLPCPAGNWRKTSAASLT